MRRNLHPIVFFAIALGFFLPTHSQAQERRTVDPPADEASESSPIQYPPITVITGVSVSRANLSSFNFDVREAVLQLGATLQSAGGEKREPAVSGEFGLGWRFNRYFAAELALGGATSIVTTQKGRLHDPIGGDWGFRLRSSANAFVVHLSLVGTLPLGEDFEVFGRVGATRQTSEVKTSLVCVEDCQPVPQHDGYPAHCDSDGKNCVDGKPDSPPTTFSRRAVFKDDASINPVFGVGLRWQAFRVEYRAMRLPIGEREAGEALSNQSRLQISGDEHTLVQTLLFTYVWGAGSTWQ